MSSLERTQGKSTAGRRIVLALAILLKSTKLVAALKLLKFTKPLVTLISLLISALAYGLWLGPWFGVGLVAVLALHEMGHVVALRWLGYPTSGPVFIPFLGAAIFTPAFDRRDHEAFIAIGGPAAGLVGVLFCLALWVATKSEILILLAFLGSFLNLFNLIPLSPLDGGRVTQIVGPWFKYIGAGVLLLVTLAMLSPAMLLIWILCLDTFSFLPKYVRPALSGALSCVMAALMMAGYSAQPWYVDVMDCMLATMITLGSIMKDVDSEPSSTADERSFPPRRTRGLWFLIYAANVVTLAALQIICASVLPPGAH